MPGVRHLRLSSLPSWSWLLQSAVGICATLPKPPRPGGPAWLCVTPDRRIQQITEDNGDT